MESKRMKKILIGLGILLLFVLPAQNGYGSTFQDYDELMQRAFSLRKDLLSNEASFGSKLDNHLIRLVIFLY